MKSSLKYTVLVVMSLFLLAACSSGGDSPSSTQIAGDIAQLELQDVSSADAKPLGARNISAPSSYVGDWADQADRPTLVPGEVIVKFKSDRIASQSLSQLSLKDASFTLERGSLGGASVFKIQQDGLTSLSSGLMTEEATIAFAKELSERDDVEYAEPNYIAYPTALPRDTNFDLQWHYPAIQLPEAWDITTGEETIVAVVDTGIYFVDGRPDLSHQDIASKILPGYDFVSNIRSAGDNDAFDPNPFDEDLGVEGGHGTHVAGTIAAISNNERDVAGVNWNAKILPVRVLGFEGGSMEDIMRGALWAAGGSVPGVQKNPNPASVINMSLGGRSPCTLFQRSIFQEIFDLGAIVVVAAGNENFDANFNSPASCPGVIVVGATDRQNNRAYYSNFGPRIDVMAPGGDMRSRATDGILSLGIAADGNFGPKFSQGTSMAAPHVAGVISLMKGLDPNLTAERALTLIRQTAIPLTPAACNRPTRRDCGTGLINAEAVLAAMGGSSTTPPPAQTGEILSFTPNPVIFAPDTNTLEFTITNTSSSLATYKIEDVNWFSDSNGTPYVEGMLGVQNAQPSGTLTAGSSVTITLSLDRDLIPADGEYSFEYVFTVNDQKESVVGRFSQGAETVNAKGKTTVVSFITEEDGSLKKENNEFVVGGAVEYSSFTTSYNYNAEPGTHFVVAWVDENGNEKVDSGDFVGNYDGVVEVNAGEKEQDADVVVSFSLGANSLGGHGSSLNTAIENAVKNLK